MMTTNEKTQSLTTLEKRIRTILPELYQDSYEDVQPVSMGSASLKYDVNGNVVWHEMWESFCDLAMAGGPPHKGTLLIPGTQPEIEAEPHQYQAVVREISRGIALVTDMAAVQSPFPGWIQVECDDAGMAEWLVRAIVMENVSAHWTGASLFLPAGPAYRIEKEVKNVITAMAKTCHYWVDHMWISQQRQIANLFAQMAAESPLIMPPFAEEDLKDEANWDRDSKQSIAERTGLKTMGRRHGWLGLECATVSTAIWMMRAMVASNVLARREGTTLFVPINEKTDPGAKRLTRIVAHVHALWLSNSSGKCSGEPDQR